VAELSDSPESWPVHATEEIWRGSAPFSVRRDQISAPNLPEETFGRLVLEHPGAVVVLAVDDQDRALVLQQYRHPPGIRFVELPAGLLDVEDEDPLPAAKRELWEEGLLVADTWSHLLTTYPSPGLSSERIEIYLAQDVTAVTDRGDFEPAHEEADMTVSWVPVADLVDGVLAGRLTDGPLAHAVLTYTLSRSSRRRGDGHMEQERSR
jgi:ADP-ribose pyrophosphatase